MSSKEKFFHQFDEAKLRPKQRELAHLLVEREFTPTDERKTMQEVADESGVCRKTIYNWGYKDPNFNAYKNYLASEMTDSYLPFVYSKLIEGIDNGSMRAIEMFLKRVGDMDTKSDVTIHQGNGDDKTQDERIEELKKRIQGDKDE